MSQQSETQLPQNARMHDVYTEVASPKAAASRVKRCSDSGATESEESPGSIDFDSL